MLTQEQAQEIISKYIELRANSKTSKTNLKSFKKYENYCVEKFIYLVDINTAKYKMFNNYQDLYSEGLLGLTFALNTYNIAKGNFFFWAHKYINTRVARHANQHSTIRFPLKYAKENAPIRERYMPNLYEENYLPEDLYESKVIGKAVITAIEKSCTNVEKEVLNSFYGIGEKALNIDNICKTKKMTRSTVINNLNSGLVKIKENILI